MSLQAGVTGQIWPAKAQPHVPCPRSGASSPRHHLPQGRENVPVCTGPAALQFISPCPGARTWYFPGQGSYPSFSEVAVLVSPTLSKLFFFPCSLFPFCNCDQCEAPVPLCALQSLWGIWSPNPGVSSPFGAPKDAGKNGPQEMWPSQSPHLTNQD